MSANVELAQQDEDTRKQNKLTSKVGVRPARPETSTTSTWGAMMRLLRIG